MGLFRVSAILLALCFVLNSCTIQKRHYRDGYYFNRVESKIGEGEKLIADTNLSRKEFVTPCLMLSQSMDTITIGCIAPEIEKAPSYIDLETISERSVDRHDQKPKNVKLGKGSLHKDVNTKSDSKEWQWTLAGTLSILFSLALLLSFYGIFWFALGGILLLLGVIFIAVAISKMITKNRELKALGVEKSSMKWTFLLLGILVNVLNLLIALLTSYLYLGNILL